MSKRKREADENGPTDEFSRRKEIEVNSSSKATIQIITGSYERILHGIRAPISHISPDDPTLPPVQFADTFLFNAHASAIRCLALSPVSEASLRQGPNILLASGGTDERVNLYSLSAAEPSEHDEMVPTPTLGGNKISEDPRNRELGSLMHHSSAITSLVFPTRSKLLSASEDNTIAVSRVKDLSVVSTIKSPRPKVLGRPSGDTAPPGAAPAGINDFAIHPSMKLMLTVGKGERCMRLWNLVTGKKAGVLNFGREMLGAVHEGKYSSGEGRRIAWSPHGQEFAVAFERGIIVFGADSRPQSRVLPLPLTKLHQMRYVSISKHNDGNIMALAVSTESGKLFFYSTEKRNERKVEAGEEVDGEAGKESSEPFFSDSICLSCLDGTIDGVNSRIKDFELLTLPDSTNTSSEIVVVTAASDGHVRIWSMETKHFSPPESMDTAKSLPEGHFVGRLLGTYATGNRITCLRAFVMTRRDRNENSESSEFEGLTEDEKIGNNSSGDEDESS